jgi:acyl carrier protein
MSRLSQQLAPLDWADRISWLKILCAERCPRTPGAKPHLFCCVSLVAEGSFGFGIVTPIQIGLRPTGITMEIGEIYEKLNTVFEDVFDDDTIIVRPELSADDVDAWDSLTHIRLLLTVESTFNVKFSASEIGKLKNVEGLAELIRSKAN